MRRLQARKGMALAMLPALLLAAGGCAKRRRPRQPRGGGAYLDDCGRGGRRRTGGFHRQGGDRPVLSALDTPPVLTYLTGDQSLLVSRMLALDELPTC